MDVLPAGALEDGAGTALAQWRRNEAILTRRRWALTLAALGIASVIMLVLCSQFGAASIAFTDMLFAVIRLVQTGQLDASSIGTPGVIFLQVRLPRVLMAFLVGGSLAAVGVTLQALLRNPLADPYVLGVSSGAALGAALAMLLGVASTALWLPLLPVWGFIGGLLALALIYHAAQSRGRLPIHSLLLAGVILNAILTAIIMFVTSIMEPARSAGFMTWLMGALAGPSLGNLAVTASYVVVVGAVLFRYAPVLNVLTQGEEVARSLGVDTERTKKQLYVLTALLTGAVVSVSGMIGFIGMVVPHAVRLVIGTDHRLLMPASALAGGMFLVMSDTVARTVLAPAEIPVGIVTALAGGPFFLSLLLRQKDRMV
ncbi:MAG: iron ABC transporter permease [Nitrospira sp.]